MNKKVTSTSEYISLFTKWESQMSAIHDVLQKTELKETIKWGAPCYTYNDKNLVGLAGFKNHCAVWFHKGSLLKDTNEVLINAQPGKTKLLRQWRFQEGESVDVDLLQEYILEAIELEKTS